MTGLHELLHPLLARSAPVAWAHLWTSTLVLAAALLVARWRRFAPGAREAIEALGLVKLLLPGTALLLALRAAGLNLAEWWPTPESTPAPATGDPLALGLAGPGRPGELPCVLALLWLAGAVGTVLLRYGRRRRLLRALLRGAVPFEGAGAPLLHRAGGGAPSVRILRGTGGLPATFGTRRPVVVLPAHGAVEPAALPPLLAHELAHVRRRDDARAWLTFLVAALYWFHPLAWLAARRLALSREAACDRLAAREVGVAAYLSALHLVCRSAIAPAELTAWASGALRERIELLMDAQRRRTVPNALALTVACLAAVLVAVASGLAAPPSAASTVESEYAVEATVVRSRDGFVVSAVVTDDEATPITAPRIGVAAGEEAKVETRLEDGTSVTLRVLLDEAGTGTLHARVVRADEVLLEQTLPLGLQSRAATPFDPKRPLSLELRDADLREVLAAFAAMAGLRLQIRGELDSKVTVDLHDVPWSDALDRVVHEAGMRWRVDGDQLVVSPAAP
jgi:hypothetical protein